jgi:hypothetical protein
MDYSASQIESIVRQVLEGMNNGGQKHECKCGGSCKCGGHGHSHGETKKPKRPKGPMYISNWTESHSHNDDQGNYFISANAAG